MARRGQGPFSFCRSMGTVRPRKLMCFTKWGSVMAGADRKPFG